MISLVLVAALLPLYLVRLQLGSLPTNLLELLVIALTVVQLASAKGRRALLQGVHALPRPVLTSCGIFVAAAVVSTSISAESQVSLGIFKGWIVIPLLLAILVWTNTRSSPLLRRYLEWALISSGTVVALLGIAQLGTLARVKSIYDVPNSLALWLVPIICLTLWPAVYDSRHRRLRLSFGCIQLVALLATQSGGGMAALLTSGLLAGLVWLKGSERRRVLSAVLIGTLIAGSVLVASGRAAYFLAPLTNAEATNSLSVRWQLWSVAAELLREHPWRGVGLGQFEPHYQRVLHERFSVSDSQPIPEFVHRDPHNWLLSFWLNTGILGLVSFAFVHGYIGWLAWHRRDRLTPHTEAALLALTSLLLFGFVDTLFWKNDLAALHLVLLAVVLAYLSASKIEG
jgi:putative inorganic carbon (HCO3(-)) transporter